MKGRFRRGLRGKERKEGGNRKAEEVRRKKEKEKQQFVKSSVSCTLKCALRNQCDAVLNDSAELVGDKGMIIKVPDNSAKKKNKPAFIIIKDFKKLLGFYIFITCRCLTHPFLKVRIFS